MIIPGNIVLVPFPYTNLEKSKIRPALVLKKLPGDYEDYLLCMISSQVNRAIVGFDEVLYFKSEDFKPSGLKAESVFCLSRLATVEAGQILGSLGKLSENRLKTMLARLSDWLREDYF